MQDVRDYIGIPFRERGRDREGCDCWGLVRLVLAERFGLELPAFDGYGSVRDRERIPALIADDLPAWNDVTSRERPGDVVLLAIGGRPLHVGLVISSGTMLHVERGIDACLERYDRLPWGRRVLGVYRHRDLAPRRGSSSRSSPGRIRSGPGARSSSCRRGSPWPRCWRSPSPIRCSGVMP